MITPHPFTAALVSLSLLGWQDSATKPGPEPAPAPKAPSISKASLFPSTMQYRLVSGLIVIDAALGTGLPRPAAIDTGLPAIVIESEAAKRLTLKAGDPHDLKSLYGPLKVSDLPAQMLRLSQVQIENLPLSSAARMGVLSGRHPIESPDFWLGTPLFEQLTVTLEPARTQVIFTAASTPMPAKAPTVPFEVKDGAMVVSAKANGKSAFSAIVDTGAFGLLIPASVASELKLKPGAVAPVTLPDGKPGKVAEVTLKELTIGAMKFKDLRALYILEGSSGPIGSYGIIGTDLLLRHRVTFSFAQHKLAFEKPRPPEPAKVAKPKPPEKTPKPNPAQPAAPDKAAPPVSPSASAP